MINTFKTKKSRLFVLVASGLTLLITALAGHTFGLYPANWDRPKHSPFELEVWRSISLSQIYSDHTLQTRLDMVDDLLAKYDFTGWSRDEVEKILGKPDVDQNYRTPPRIYYALGYTSDTVWLIVWLNEQGRVIKVEKHFD